jgi:hypothetical protein
VPAGASWTTRSRRWMVVHVEGEALLLGAERRPLADVTDRHGDHLEFAPSASPSPPASWNRIPSSDSWETRRIVDHQLR